MFTTVGLLHSPELVWCGRFVTRCRALALQRVEHGRALPADVPAGADVQVDVEGEIRAQDPLAQVACIDRLRDGLAHDLSGPRVLGADEKISRASPDGIAGQHHPLEKVMRAAFHDEPVLERPRLRLVGVGHQKARPGVLVAHVHETPFAPRREPGPAAARQSRVEHRLGDVLWRHPGEGLPQRLISTEGLVLLQAERRLVGSEVGGYRSLVIHVSVASAVSVRAQG